MNSFRVMNTRFRILKGGKIGLSFSIALIGGLMMLSSTKAYSQTYFDGVTDTIYSSGDISVTAKSDTGISSVNYSSIQPSTDIIFQPERVVSSYKGVMDYEVTGTSPNQSINLAGSNGTNNGSFNSIANGNYTYTGDDGYGHLVPITATNYDRAYYDVFTPSKIFTITLDSGAEAKNISKNNSVYYSVDSTNGYITNNDSYTANLIFSGSNTIWGNTDIENGNIQLNGNIIFKGTVKAGSLDVNAGITNFEDNLTATTTTITTGIANFNTLRGTTNSNIVFSGAGTANLYGNLTGSISGAGTLTTTGATNQTITGAVGNIGNLNVSNIGFTTTVAGNVNAANTKIDSTLIMTDGSNVTSTITGTGTLTLAGNSTVTGTVGNSTTSLGSINANGASDKTVIFKNDVYAINTNIGAGTVDIKGNLTGSISGAGTLTTTGATNQTITGAVGNIGNLNVSNTGFTTTVAGNVNAANTKIDSTLIMTDGSNVTSTITGTGNLTLDGNSTVTGTVGNSTTSLGSINANGASDKTVIFKNDVYAINTNIGAGTVDFNTASGTTNTNIIFTDKGIANLNNGLTGNIDFSGKDATINVSNGKGILGSVQTLALNNTGILNFQGDGTITGNIGSSITSGIKELNINTNNEQNTPDGVVAGVVGLARELYTDVVNLKNNATLTLLDNTNMLNSGLGSDKIFITTNVTNTGTLNFKGTSNITGEVGQSDKVLYTINAGVTGETVTFNDMVYATTLKYSDDGKVVLNGDNSSNASSEGMIGTVDFDNKAGTLAIGDDVNLTVGAAGTQFINGNDAILEFAGSSIITGILGGNTAGNSTFKEIHAGADGKTVTFKNNVYVKESTLHVSGKGTVNFQGNLIGSLIYDDDGVANVSDGKNIVVSSSVLVAVTTATTDTGSLNFLGTTTLYTDIGTSTKRLKNVTFGSAGSASNSYTQNLDKNIYAQNTYIGNGTNQTILEMNDDITFGGSLTVRANSALDVSTHDITVTNNLTLAANSLTRFKIYTDDITASGSSVGAPSGSITTDTLTIDDNAIIKVNYIGTLYGAGSYNLIFANGIIGTYYGTEANGKVSDNSIIDSIIKVDGNNLILFADRTGGGKYGVEDLYIEKSGIGEHYSNGASQALAGYAYDTLVREGALGNIVTRIEELDGGLYLSSEKKAQMVEIQKLLAPVANNSSIQSSLTASTLVSSTIKDRMSDMRFSSSTDFIPYSGYSSGTYTLNNSLWIKAMGSKATQSKVQDYDGYNSTTLGFVAGMDRTLRSGSTIGLALAHANTKINQTDFRSGDSADTQSIQFSTYGSMDFDDTYVDGILSYARHDTDSTRTANSGKLSSSSTADQISAKVEVGHRVYFEDVATLTPFVSVEYGNLNQKGYTEKGTAYQNDALKVDSVKVNKGTLGAGAKLSTNLNIGDTVIVPEFKLAAYNAFGDTKADIKAQYVGGGNQFVTPTQDLNKTMFNAGLGVKTTLSESTSLMIGVDYDRSKDGNFQGYSGNVSFRLNF
ncbi:autotransporter outer membrane beta-barrel domain-containing protein [Arcobacter caeni]|uniref:Autotransporter domain-containing protein n=1 Tax=Arcobacter caeni TaxID=1912877 RepID=A0A363CXU0_9BACT|nr:autotransporter outer membrane beta-barrel domain-containing protein [Arcobacter caeni]PUE63916.1 hypothetical protein B0174_08670 [Arcobacter caeni]